MTDLTFTKLSGDYRANGEDFVYIVSREARKWTIHIYAQNVMKFASDNTEIILAGEHLHAGVEDSLKLAKEWAQGFESSKANTHDYGRRAIDAANHVANQQ
jgi:hypothetical protein